MPEDIAVTAVNEAVAQLEPLVISKLDDFAMRGHALINAELARARTLANSYPAVGVLLPVIESALHGLFNHLLAGPHADPVDAGPSRDETSDTIVVDGKTVPAPHMTPETLEAIAEVGAAEFPPIRDDKVPAPTGTEAGTAG